MNKTFIVTGMHRSATSLVAKGLQQAGVDMGEGHFIPPNEGNPEGYWEDERFVKTNDIILATNGGSWISPPENIHETGANTRMTKLTKREGMWGFKDPRTCHTLDFWLPYMGLDPVVVGVFRKPENVVKSLERRGDGIPKDHARWMCDAYNARLIQNITKFVGL